MDKLLIFSKKDLLSSILNRDFSVLAKSITAIENQSSNYQKLINDLYVHRKKSHKIGITGPPGSGKSTITSKIVTKYLNENNSVAVICVDPSSSFNGGAILGDRIRMQEVYGHKNVFIRSLATRGSLGGMTNSIADIEILLEAFGFDVIIYETVGVGQIEIDVANYADSLILVLTPESGDDIQMMKAGLIEFASIIAINKSDRPGASKMKLVLEQVVSFNDSDWAIPIVETVALQNKNIDTLCASISNHYSFLVERNLLDKKNNQKYLQSIIRIIKDHSLKKSLNSKSMEIINNELLKPVNKRISSSDMFLRLKK